MADKTTFVLRDINTAEICIDSLGQRDVNRRRAQFREIMNNFDPNLVQPVSVALIDGKYYCFDGQMTMKVLKARNRDQDLCVRCRVYESMTKLDCANMFIKQRGITSPVTLTDKIRVQANYGDQKALSFIKITEANGLNVSWTGNKCKNAVVAVSTLWAEYSAINNDELYAKYIRVLKGAWDGDPQSLVTQILKGLGLFLRTYRESAKEDVLIRQLAKKRPVDLIRDAQADRTSGSRKYAVQILLAYNFGMREENRLPQLL